jgi:predicted DNA-binding protein
MDVPFSPDEQSRIDQLASRMGQSSEEFVRQVMAGYLADLEDVRGTLENRYNDIESGLVQPVNGEEVFARLRWHSKEQRATRS